MLERTACYVCDGQAGVVWARENGHIAVRCADCGLVYVNPRPRLENISAAARTGLHEGATELDRVGSYGGEPRIRRYASILRDVYGDGYFHRSGERWLDYGCGYGEFLEALRQESRGTLKLVGLEPNEVKAASARERGLDVSFEPTLPKGPFRYISLLNVYSHLPNPPETLAELGELLEPGGELLLETGNFAELEREQIPAELDLPDHLSFAGERLVRRVLGKAGFRVQSVVRYPMFARPRGLRARLAARQPSRGSADLWFRSIRE